MNCHFAALNKHLRLQTTWTGHYVVFCRWLEDVGLQSTFRITKWTFNNFIRTVFGNADSWNVKIGCGKAVCLIVAENFLLDWIGSLPWMSSKHLQILENSNLTAKNVITRID